MMVWPGLYANGTLDAEHIWSRDPPVLHMLFEPVSVYRPVDHWWLTTLNICNCELKSAFSCILCLTMQATKAVKGTLNKLTPEKFERLLQQLVDVVTSAEILHTTISLVFESAVAQPTFVAMYADLCDRLSKVGWQYHMLPWHFPAQWHSYLAWLRAACTQFSSLCCQVSVSDSSALM